MSKYSKSNNLSNMNYFSVCSGIEAASVAWSPLGWHAVGFSEIEAFPSAVLAHHYPDVKNYGNLQKFENWNISDPVDLLVGGTPCQAFSVAGKRESLADERGNLALTFCKLADKLNPKWVLWENVPGVLNTKDNAFGCFVAELCGANAPISPPRGGKFPNCGVLSGPKRTLAWRMLDAQWFGVPQRRKRVFLLASRNSNNWSCANALLPLGEIVPSHNSTLERAREASAPSLGNGFKKHHVFENNPSDGRYRQCHSTASTAIARWGTGGNNLPIIVSKKRYSLCSRNAPNVHFVISGDVCDGRFTRQRSKGCSDKGISYTLLTKSPHAVVSNLVARRLLPIECERLQGFPDNYTKIPYKKKSANDCPDSLRYAALGNSMAVPVMRYIANRIQVVEKQDFLNCF